MEKKPDEEYLSVAEIANQLHIHIETVRRWIKSGQLPAIEIGGRYRILKDDLQTFLNKHRKQPSSPTN